MKSKRNLRLVSFIALVASSSLGFELLQTRVLSALYFNNVVYMTVTIALLGFGISGVLASVMQRKILNPDRLAAYSAAGMAISILLCIHVASSLPSTLPDVPALYKMILSYFFLVLPFLFAGSALSLIFMNHGKNIFGLYFIDLCASGIAAILFSLLLWPLGAPNFAWICAAAALAASLLHLSGEINLREVIFISAMFIAAYFLVGQKIINNQPEVYKSTARFFDPEYNAKLEASAWTNVAKIDIYSDPLRDFETNQFLGHPSNFMFIAQDNDAPTMIHGKKDLDIFKNTAAQGHPTDLNTLAYFMEPNAKNALVIGVGGGVDVALARIYGAQNIDGAEINPATIKFVTKRFRDYAQWPLWQDIHIYNSEGRHFARNANKKYDVIIMHGVDTFSALNSGAYVLTENYLYTVEAIKDYLNDLKPNGMMAICRWFFLQPRESLRLANLFINAATTTGTGPADQRIMVINYGSWATTFIKREPFTPAEVETSARLAKLANYSWIYIPKVLGAKQQRFEQEQFSYHHDNLLFARNAYQALIAAPNKSARDAFIHSYPYKIDAVYDDKPFFFEYYKKAVNNIKNEYWTSREDASSANFNQLRGPVVHYVLYVLLFLTTGVCALSMGIPLLILERNGIKIPRAYSLIGFFCSLGFGFMFVEIGCMQWLNLYLGNPMYSLMVVLASLLWFAGMGSLLIGKSSLNIENKLKLGMLCTAVMILVWLLAMKIIMPLTEHLSATLRIFIVITSLLPLGLSMGMPFASGLRHLADHQPEFISWAWGINGLTSVTASVLAIILAMKIGFTAVIILSAFIYAAGYLSFRHYLSAYKR